MRGVEVCSATFIQSVLESFRPSDYNATRTKLAKKDTEGGFSGAAGNDSSPAEDDKKKSKQTSPTGPEKSNKAPKKQ